MKAIDPWKDQAIRDYAKLLREFGIQDFRPLARRIPDLSLCGNLINQGFKCSIWQQK